MMSQVEVPITLTNVYGDTDQVSINVLDDCVIDLAEVFPAIEPVPPQASGAKPPPMVTE